MKLFVTIYLYEIKKILKTKIPVLLCLSGFVFLFGITMAEYLVISPEDKYTAAIEKDIEGKEIDDTLIKKVATEAANAGGMTSVSGVYGNLAAYMNRAMGYYMNIEGVTRDYNISDLSEEYFYQTRIDIISYLQDYYYLTDSEKAYWQQKENEITKPFVWYSNYGIRSIRTSLFPGLALSLVTIGISLAGIFASEKRQRTEALILSSKEGKGTILYAKMMATVTFSLLVAFLYYFALSFPHIIFNGFHGSKSVCQIMIPFSSYTYSAGEYLLILTSLYFLAAVLFGVFTALLSKMLKNTMAVSGIICGLVMFDLFFSLSPKLRLLSQIRYLSPLQILVNSAMADPRLFKIGSVFLNAYQSAGVAYILLIIIFIIVLSFFGKKQLE
jgi:hypothetical protein